jgi:RNA polymerase sigma-70 factor (ECF subfamily)
MVSTVEAASPGIQLPPDEQSWIALIRRIAKADSAALGELYDATNRLVFGLVLRIVRDPGAAEEVTIDVFTQIWRQAATYDLNRGVPSAWLFMLARSRAIDRLRSRARQNAERVQPLDDAYELPDPSPNPEQASTSASRTRLIRSALEGLPKEQREAIELAYFSGLSHSEIAAQSGEPLGTVKTRLRLGMARLRELLRPIQGGHGAKTL